MKHFPALMLVTGLSLGAVATGCYAKQGPVQPGELEAAIASARPGDRLVLARGEFGPLDITNRSYSSVVTIDASAATINGISIRSSRGIAIMGGTVRTDPAQNFVISVDSSKDISLSGIRVSGGRIGITVSRSQDVKVQKNDFDGVRSDGVNIAMSQRVLIEGNLCHNFNPIPATYDAAGKLVKDGDHPDCVQAWSNPRYPPTADIAVVGNKGTGFMQGVFFGNPGQGGYDRLIVRNNEFTLSAFNGIVLDEARDSVVRDNIVRTMPGAKMNNYPFRAVTSWIRVNGRGNQICGNTVDKPQFSDGKGACAKP
jgi:nitrous oxidase accessory protein NosD